MKKEHTNDYPPQITLLLRIVGGAYLLYLAWGLRIPAFSDEHGALYGISAIVFAVVGAALCVISIRAVSRGEYKLPYEADESAPDENADRLDKGAE